MGTTVVFVILGVAAGLVVGVVMYLRGRPKAEEDFYHFRCVKCKRRLRYLERQVGHKGKCSNCGGDVLFPPISHSID